MVDFEPKTELGRTRLEICMKCPWLRKDALSCRKCGCGVNLKVDRPQNYCPIGRW